MKSVQPMSAEEINAMLPKPRRRLRVQCGIWRAYHVRPFAVDGMAGISWWRCIGGWNVAAIVGRVGVYVSWYTETISPH